MYKLATQKNKALHRKTKRVENFEDPKIRRLVLNMKKTMKEEDGIGLAAPQVGKSLQIFVVDGKCIRETEKENASRFHTIKKLFRKKIRETFINPKILSISEKGFIMNEGCLSVPGVFGSVPRAEKITIVAQDERGKKFKATATGLYAHVIQHEIDHLDGILFIEKAKEGSLYKIKERDKQ